MVKNMVERLEFPEGFFQKEIPHATEEPLAEPEDPTEEPLVNVENPQTEE